MEYGKTICYWGWRTGKNCIIFWKIKRYIYFSVYRLLFFHYFSFELTRVFLETQNILVLVDRSNNLRVICQLSLTNKLGSLRFAVSHSPFVRLVMRVLFGSPWWSVLVWHIDVSPINCSIYSTKHIVPFFSVRFNILGQKIAEKWYILFLVCSIYKKIWLINRIKNNDNKITPFGTENLTFFFR